MTAPIFAAGSGASLERGLECLNDRPEPGCLGLYLRSVDADHLHGKIQIVPFKCRSWGCLECGPRKGRATARAARLACESLDLNTLLTLTLPGRGDPRRGSPRLSRESAARMWNALRTELRAYGKPKKHRGPWKHGYLVNYLAVPEWQKDGTAHIHVGTDREIPHAVLSEVWARLGGGFVWVSPRRKMRDAGDVGRYLAKYLSKTVPANPPWDAWVCRERGPGSYRRRPWRRFWASRDVGAAMRSDPADPTTTWDVVVPVVWTWGTEWAPFAALNTGHAVPGCDGHNLPDWGDCHHAGPGWKCKCGPPERALKGVVAEVCGRSPHSWRCVRCEVVHRGLESPTVCAPESGGGCGRTLEGRLEGDEIADWTVFVPAEWTREQVDYFMNIEHAAERPRLLDFRTFPRDRRRGDASRFRRHPGTGRPEIVQDAKLLEGFDPGSRLEIPKSAPSAVSWRCACDLCKIGMRGCERCPRCREGFTWKS